MLIAKRFLTTSLKSTSRHSLLVQNTHKQFHYKKYGNIATSFIKDVSTKFTDKYKNVGVVCVIPVAAFAGLMFIPMRGEHQRDVKEIFTTQKRKYSTTVESGDHKSSVDDACVIERLLKISSSPGKVHQIQVGKGDLTAQSTDAIVNAANELLSHGGGVAGAISRKGGPEISQQSVQWVKKHGPVKTGTTAITSSGNLPCKYVIHAVGPIWHGGRNQEPQLLGNAVYESLKRCDEYELRSVSIPAISSGIFGFPKPLCAKILLHTAQQYIEQNAESTSLEIIRFVNFDDETVEIFKEEFDHLYPSKQQKV